MQILKRLINARAIKEAGMVTKTNAA